MLAGVERKMLGPDDIKRQFEEMKTKITTAFGAPTRQGERAAPPANPHPFAPAAP